MDKIAELYNYEHDNMPVMLDFLTRKAMETEDKVLTKALTDFLGRKPEPNDFSDCNFLYQLDKPGEYELFYLAKKIGKIIRHWSQIGYNSGNPQYIVTFYPVNR